MSPPRQKLYLRVNARVQKTLVDLIANSATTGISAIFFNKMEKSYKRELLQFHLIELCMLQSVPVGVFTTCLRICFHITVH